MKPHHLPDQEGIGLPVLLLVFNRPDLTRQVFEAIRQARPGRLYIAADGPRPARPGDQDLCKEVLEIVAAVDWPCRVERLHRPANLGCKRAVSEALDWFFSCETEGVVLEDDCVPSPDFFVFAQEMLARYRDDKTVFAVQGNCFTRRVPGYSYYFSRNFFMWGWATWADRWRQVQLDDDYLRQIRESGALAQWPSPGWAVRTYWQDILDRQIAGEFDSWGYPTTFNLLARRQYNLTPTVNLVRNIGFGPGASHSKGIYVGPLNEGFGNLRHPLLHCERHRSPESAFRDENRWRIGIRVSVVVRRRLETLFPALTALARAIIRGTRLRQRSR